MENTGQNPLDIIYNTKINIEERINTAMEIFEQANSNPNLIENQMYYDLLLKWSSRNISTDNGFATDEKTWSLFDSCIDLAPYNDHFSIPLKGTKSLTAAFQSHVCNLAQHTMEKLINHYPNSWRPGFKDLNDTLISITSDGNNIHKEQVSFILKIIKSHREYLVGSSSTFEKGIEAYDNLINNIGKLNKDDVIDFLAHAICGQNFFQKIGGTELGTHFDTLISKLSITDENTNSIRNGTIDFLHKFIQVYKEGATVYNINDMFQFPLKLFKRFQEKCTNEISLLEIAAPILEECRKLNIYSRHKEDTKEYKELVALTDLAIKNNNQSALTQLCLLDFRLVSNQLCDLLEFSDEEFAVAALEMAFELRRPSVIFGYNELFYLPTEGKDTMLPDRVVNFPRFVTRYTELVGGLVSTQLNGVLCILASSSRQADNVMLFWTVQGGRFTSEHAPAAEFVIKHPQDDPWRIAAAACAARILRIKARPLITDDSVREHPIFLYYYLDRPLYGADDGEAEAVLMAPSRRIRSSTEVPSVPTPEMPSERAYRTGFIISKLPELVHCFVDEDLQKIVWMVLDKAPCAEEIQKPKTIADVCMRLLSNSFFYESRRIRAAFHTVAPQILEDESVDENRRRVIAMIISAMPLEFIKPISEETEEIEANVAVSSFNLLKNFLQEGWALETGELFAEAAKNVPAMIERILAALPKNYVRNNLWDIIDILPKPMISKNLPTLLNIADGLPKRIKKTPEVALGIAEWCAQNQKPLPFKELQFPDEVVNTTELICAQARAGMADAVSHLIMKTMYTTDNVDMIMSTLSECDLSPFETSKLRVQLDHMMKVATKDGRNVDPDVLSALVTAMPTLPDRRFAVTNPVFVTTFFKWANTQRLTVAVLAGVSSDPETYQEHYKEVVDGLLSEVPEPAVLHALARIRLARLFDEETVGLFFFVVTKYSNECRTLAETCTLCSTVGDIFANTRCAAKVPVQSIEVIRKLSSVFFRIAQSEPVTMRHLKTVGRMFSTSSRVMRAEFQHYLVSSFISHVLALSADEPRMTTVAQSLIFPMIGRCSKEQLGEVTTALHETHRQLFQVIYKRWTGEAQYKGKV